MIKNNKGKLIVASVVTLLPMLFALLGRFLPEEIAVHWGFGGEADGFASPAQFFLILPPILLCVNWLCLIITDRIEKEHNQNPKLMAILIWTIPFISVFASVVTLCAAVGFTARLHSVVLLLLAVVFFIIGNYMPKTTRNITMGIKVRWALSGDENWNATHRFGGKVFVGAGLLCLVGTFLPMGAFLYILFAIILIATLAPVLYSYFFYRKQLKEGKITKEAQSAAYGELVKNKKAAVIGTVCLIVVLAIGLPLLMFTGNVKTTLNEESFTVEATYWKDLTVRYEDIDSVEYRADGVDGARIGGFGSARLLLGRFENDSLGIYTRYTYAKESPCIVIKVGNNTLVLGAETAGETQAIYDRILAKIS